MEDNQAQLLEQQLLSRLKADSRSSSEIARLACVSQPTVSRMRQLKGKRQRISRSFNKLCNFYGLASVGHPTKPSVMSPKADREYYDLLRDAIIEMWDGTEASGKALLALIKCLKAFNGKVDDTAGD